MSWLTSATSLSVLTLLFLVIAKITAGRPLEAARLAGRARAVSTRATAVSGTGLSSRGESTVRRPRVSASAVRPITRTSQSSSPTRARPAKVSRNHARTASAIWAPVSPRAAASNGVNSMRNSGSPWPVASTRSTPGRRSSSSLIWRAVRRRRASAAGPVSSTIAVGKPFDVVSSCTSGSRASAGRSLLYLLCTRRRRSVTCLSNWRSETSRKRTRMTDALSRLVDDTKRMSGRVRIASSSGSVTCFSTSSAAAPGSTVLTTSQLKLISGSCSRGIDR